MDCCGQPCSTKFCPHCGETMALDPLVRLLRHIRGTQATAERTATKYEEYANETDREAWSRESCLRKASRSRRTAQKWQAWGEALAEVLGE